MKGGSTDRVLTAFSIGDPDYCLNEIQRCIEAVGANTMIFRVHWAGMSHEATTRSLRLLGERVLPRL